MKVTIVNCFDTYEHRVDLLHSYFKENGYDVTVIQSNFRHFQKVKREEKKEDFIFIDTLPYYKNMSIDRMKSHYKFSKLAFKKVEEIKPDLLYVLIPANSLAKFSGAYKKKNKDVKLYFDLIDLWPETMPIGKMKSLPPFTLWRSLRDSYLNEADYVITECDLYQEVLGERLKNIKTKTIYLARENKKFDSNTILCKDEIHLCYLGSINNIIDISTIKAVIEEINLFKPVTLHIIGDGESKNELISEVKSVGATVEYHGKIYDGKKKQEIFDKCHFGLNIMKNTVCVGLTMKSIDYFEGGLPIINNIQGDTMKIVKDYEIGINLDETMLKDIVNRIVNYEVKEILRLKNNTRNTFERLFTVEQFNKNIQDVIKGC